MGIFAATPSGEIPVPEGKGRLEEEPGRILRVREGVALTFSIKIVTIRQYFFKTSTFRPSLEISRRPSPPLWKNP